jgi:hypothetical protein
VAVRGQIAIFELQASLSSQRIKDGREALSVLQDLAKSADFPAPLARLVATYEGSLLKDPTQATLETVLAVSDAQPEQAMSWAAGGALVGFGVAGAFAIMCGPPGWTALAGAMSGGLVGGFSLSALARRTYNVATHKDAIAVAAESGFSPHSTGETIMGLTALGLDVAGGAAVRAGFKAAGGVAGLAAAVSAPVAMAESRTLLRTAAAIVEHELKLAGSAASKEAIREASRRAFSVAFAGTSLAWGGRVMTGAGLAHTLLSPLVQAAIDGGEQGLRQAVDAMVDNLARAGATVIAFTALSAAAKSASLAGLSPELKQLIREGAPALRSVRFSEPTVLFPEHPLFKRAPPFDWDALSAEQREFVREQLMRIQQGSTPTIDAYLSLGLKNGKPRPKDPALQAALEYVAMRALDAGAHLRLQALEADSRTLVQRHAFANPKQVSAALYDARAQLFLAQLETASLFEPSVRWREIMEPILLGQGLSVDEARSLCREVLFEQAYAEHLGNVEVSGVRPAAYEGIEPEMAAVLAGAEALLSGGLELKTLLREFSERVDSELRGVSNPTAAARERAFLRVCIQWAKEEGMLMPEPLVNAAGRPSFRWRDGGMFALKDSDAFETARAQLLRDYALQGTPHGVDSHLLQMILLGRYLNKALAKRTEGPRNAREFFRWFAEGEPNMQNWYLLLDREDSRGARSPERLTSFIDAALLDDRGVAEKAAKAKAQKNARPRLAEPKVIYFDSKHVPRSPAIKWQRLTPKEQARVLDILERIQRDPALAGVRQDIDHLLASPRKDLQRAGAFARMRFLDRRVVEVGDALQEKISRVAALSSTTVSFGVCHVAFDVLLRLETEVLMGRPALSPQETKGALAQALRERGFSENEALQWSGRFVLSGPD